MTCTSWHDHLIGRLYDELGAEADAALTAHLAGCEECRATLDEFQGVRTRLREDAGDMPRVPRVVVLRDRPKFRPALLAASILGAVALAGAGAGAGYALGLGRAPAPVAVATPKASGVSTEELVRREVDRRLAALEASRPSTAASSPSGTSSDPSRDRAVNSTDLRAEFAKLERRWNGMRAADLDYVLDQIAASEYRVGARLGKTNDALRTVALANTSYMNEQ